MPPASATGVVGLGSGGAVTKKGIPMMYNSDPMHAGIHGGVGNSGGGPPMILKQNNLVSQ